MPPPRWWLRGANLRSAFESRARAVSINFTSYATRCSQLVWAKANKITDIHGGYGNQFLLVNFGLQPFFLHFHRSLIPSTSKSKKTRTHQDSRRVEHLRAQVMAFHLSEMLIFARRGFCRVARGNLWGGRP